MRSVNSLHKQDDVIEAEVIGQAAHPAPLAHRAPSHGLATLGAWLYASALPVIWKLCKLAICMMLDLADMVMVGWIGVSPLFEIGAALMTMALWGRWRGAVAFWELADLTELFDPWMPSCTLIALYSWNKS